jgi:predicted phage terminase large subunit-like protein
MVEPPEGFDIIKAQPGPQRAFLSSPADGVIYGGSAYCAKTYGLLMDAVRYSSHQYYTGIIFRRKFTEIETPGGLWDTAQQIYAASNICANMNASKMTAEFPAGGRLKFSHLELEKNKMDHHGGQYLFIGFDELTTFTRTQWLYLITRNRPGPGCSLRPYWRATCNPDAESWVRDIIDWWIDPDTGYPLPERSGIIRYYTIEDEALIWVPPEWRDVGGLPPKSLTFIPGRITDNQEGIKRDPTYIATLRAQDRVTRERLLMGNWNITASGGMFKAEWFKIEDEAPTDLRLLRYWDMAASEEEEGKDPDYTAGALCGIAEDGTFWIVDITRFREAPGTTEGKIRAIAEQDGRYVPIGIEEERGSSGKFVTDHYQRTVLQGFEVHADYVTGDKVSRAKPWCALAEGGNVRLVRGSWNRPFLAEATGFPKGPHRDQCDSASGAYKLLATSQRVLPGYVPLRHCRAFDRSEKAFQQITAETVLLWVSMWQELDASVAGICAAWSRKSRRLRVYGEFRVEIATPEAVAAAVRSASVVPLQRSTPGRLGVDRVYGNGRMFAGGHDAASQYRKLLGAKENSLFEEVGSLVAAARMLEGDQIQVHPECTATDLDMRSWVVVDGKPAVGYPFCRSLLSIVTLLRVEGELEEKPALRSYSQERLKVRDRLRIGEQAPQTVDKGDDWLAT